MTYSVGTGQAGEEHCETQAFAERDRHSVFQKLGSLNSEPALPSTSYLPSTPSVVPASSYVPSSEAPPGERTAVCCSAFLLAPGANMSTWEVVTLPTRCYRGPKSCFFIIRTSALSVLSFCWLGWEPLLASK